MDTFRMELAALAVLRRQVTKYGHAVALMIWQIAEDAAIQAGEDFISGERMEEAERAYFGR